MAKATSKISYSLTPASPRWPHHGCRSRGTCGRGFASATRMSNRARRQGPGKVAIRPVYPMTPHRGPAPRDCVGPGREPDSSDRHGRTYGADRDFAGALGKKEVGVVGTPLFTVRSNAFYDRCAAQPTRLAMAIERAKRLVRTVGIQRPESTAQTAYRSGMHRNKPGPRAQGYCVVGLLLVTASMRSCGRWLARLVARAMLVSPLLRW